MSNFWDLPIGTVITFPEEKDNLRCKLVVVHGTKGIKISFLKGNNGYRGNEIEFYKPGNAYRSDWIVIRTMIHNYKGSFNGGTLCG